MTEYCDITKHPDGTGPRCDLQPGHPGDRHANALMNPFFPGKVAFIYEWTVTP